MDLRPFYTRLNLRSSGFAGAARFFRYAIRILLLACLHISRGFFPGAALLDNSLARRRRIFSRKRLGSGDTMLDPVRTRIEIMIFQMADRKLLKKRTTFQTLDGVLLNALSPIHLPRAKGAQILCCCLHRHS